jgi:uncharacterized ferritin-like protein (DUF455 family)
MEIRGRALDAFLTVSPETKLQLVDALWSSIATTPLSPEVIFESNPAVGRPQQPILVEPHLVPRRSPFTALGHAALMHSIAHIEFNAINLALDAVWRFPNLPPAYYLDWLKVAHEEAKHFGLLQAHLKSLGFSYGDFVAHDGLWTMCDNTRHDVVARMALVPRTLEARGLDATPIIQAKLRKVATADALAAVGILETILTEEVGHVAIGNHWYHWLCQRDHLDPAVHYPYVAALHGAPRLKPPFNTTARKLAGFSDAELEALPTS